MDSPMCVRMAECMEVMYERSTHLRLKKYKSGNVPDNHYLRCYQTVYKYAGDERDLALEELRANHCPETVEAFELASKVWELTARAVVAAEDALEALNAN